MYAQQGTAAAHVASALLDQALLLLHRWLAPVLQVIPVQSQVLRAELRDKAWY